MRNQCARIVNTKLEKTRDATIVGAWAASPQTLRAEGIKPLRAIFCDAGGGQLARLRPPAESQEPGQLLRPEGPGIPRLADMEIVAIEDRTLPQAGLDAAGQRAVVDGIA